jgi:hypothetical protein
MDSPRAAQRHHAGLAFLLLAIVWIGLRFVPAAGAPDESARAAITAVRVGPSESGRLRILGLPVADGIAESAEATAARGALEARVAALNADLAARATRLAGRLEEFEGGTVALRVAGLAVPFHDHEARRLALAAETASERPWLALQTISDVLAARLEEPPSGAEIEATVRRRELTRTFRGIQDALDAAEADARTAAEAYHAAAIAAATPRPDAFHREGRARLLEALLAAWLAVTLHGWLRPRSVADLGVAGAAAGVAAAAALLALEGSPLLPIGRGGVAPVFLPLSVAIGWGIAELLGRPEPETATDPGEPDADRAAAPPDTSAPTRAPIPRAELGPREPDLREIARDLLAAERQRPSVRRPPGRPPGPRSEREVEEDPVVGPARRAFGPPGGPSTPAPRHGPHGSATPPSGVSPPAALPPPTDPPPASPPPAARLPFFRRRRR